MFLLIILNGLVNNKVFEYLDNVVKKMISIV